MTTTNKLILQVDKEFNLVKIQTTLELIKHLKKGRLVISKNKEILTLEDGNLLLEGKVTVTKIKPNNWYLVDDPDIDYWRLKQNLHLVSFK